MKNSLTKKIAPEVLEEKKRSLLLLLDEINQLLVDVIDASPQAEPSIIERKQEEALNLGVNIAISQIFSKYHAE
ncbi:hypothetical protein TDB9533_00365 [Thalassocella blandensis]|nr:hypothetical protein TDB9533_00365 [Thalassocella blandensis]